MLSVYKPYLLAGTVTPRAKSQSRHRWGPWHLQMSAGSPEDEDPMAGESEEGECPQLRSQLVTSLDSVLCSSGGMTLTSRGALAVSRDIFICHLGLGMLINVCRAQDQ